MPTGEPRKRSRRTVRTIAAAIALLAIGYVFAVGAWLWAHRDGIRGPDVSTGVMLVGAAALLAWLAGFAGTASGSPAGPQRRRWPELGVAVSHMTAGPLSGRASRSAAASARSADCVAMAQWSRTRPMCAWWPPAEV